MTNLDQMTDEELVRLYRARHAVAFDALYDRYKKPIYNFFLRRFGRSEVAGDLLQETMLRALCSLDTFDDSRSFRAWVYGIARHVASEFARKRDEKHGSIQSIDEPKANKMPEDVVYNNERSWHLDECLKGLKLEARECLELHYKHELNQKEVADVIGKSHDATRAIISRARRALAACLSARGVGRGD